MSSKAKQAFEENLKDLHQLWEIHKDYSGRGAGRKHGVEVLNRSAIVLITACWESLVEDLAKEAFDFMLAEVTAASSIPSKVQAFASKAILEQKNIVTLWQMADNGWRGGLITHRNEELNRWLEEFHTPKTAQVNELYLELLGTRKVSSDWSWQRMTSQQAGDKLDEYITIRGNIAHRVKHNEEIYKDWGTDYLAHVERLVTLMDKTVSDHLTTVCKKQPW